MDQTVTVQLIFAEYVRKSSAVGDGTDLGLFLDQIVTNKAETARRRGFRNVRLGVPIQPQDASTWSILNSLFQVIQMVKVVEAIILVNDVAPILVLKLIDEMLAEHSVQTHNLNQSGNLGPIAIFPPFLSVGRIKTLGGDEQWCRHLRANYDYTKPVQTSGHA